MRVKIALLLACLLVGCAGPIRTASHISYGTPITAWPPQVPGQLPAGTFGLIQLPVTVLNGNGQTANGVLNEYETGEVGISRLAFDLPRIDFPTNTLTITVSQPLSVTTDQTQAPVAWLWVVMSPQGDLLESTVLPNPQNTYTFTQPGDYVVKVLAEWERKNYVAYLFRVAVVNK